MCRTGPVLCAWLLIVSAVSVKGQATDPVSDLLRRQQLDLATDGHAFLLTEASRASFLLIGGLHGDQQTPALVDRVVTGVERFGYRVVAVEMSPWAAGRLEASLKNDEGMAVRGADIEELQPHLLIRELAAVNPGNQALQSMAEMTRTGYRRSQAAELLKLARQAGNVKDISAGGLSVHSVMLKTLEVDVDRLNPDSGFTASVRRETVMKDFFLAHYRGVSQGQTKPKVAAVFGRNHLHRGYDRRGVSTLGNFIAELAVAEGVQSFHVALFAAGGTVALGGLRNIDERKDDPAFEFLASLARHAATVFDLRPLRQLLRKGPVDALPARDASLLYWADSYDAVICFREVTPVQTARPAQ